MKNEMSLTHLARDEPADSIRMHNRLRARRRNSVLAGRRVERPGGSEWGVEGGGVSGKPWAIPEYPEYRVPKYSFNEEIMISSAMTWPWSLVMYSAIGYLFFISAFAIFVYFEKRDIDFILALLVNENGLTPEGISSKQMLLWRAAQISRWITAYCAILFVIYKLIQILF